MKYLKRYRIWTNGNEFRIKQRVFFIWKWIPHPNYRHSQPKYTLYSLQSALDHINSLEWELLTSENIDELVKEDL